MRVALARNEVCFRTARAESLQNPLLRCSDDRRSIASEPTIGPAQTCSCIAVPDLRQTVLNTAYNRAMPCQQPLAPVLAVE